MLFHWPSTGWLCNAWQVDFNHKTSKKALEAINQKFPESTLSIQVGKIEEETTGITCSDGTPTGKASSEEQQDA